MNERILIFRKIKFYDVSYGFVIKHLKKSGGYLVMPAASSLSQIDKNHNYTTSLKKSAFAIFDSGFFCFCLIILKLKKFNKFSGYKFVKNFLEDNSNKNDKILLLDPDRFESKKNYLLMKKHKFKYIKQYVCPIYNRTNFKDKKLLILIKKYKPKMILINIAGGVQEPLALFIKKNIRFKICTICSGAAIAFFTGVQAPINYLIDKYYLGWLLRIIYNPKNFIRIIFSLRLLYIVLKTKVVVKSIKKHQKD